MDLLTALGVAALLTRIGIALYATGTVRAKNAGGAVLRVIADLCIAVLAFWAIGAAILFQSRSGLFSIEPRYLVGWGVGVADSPMLFFVLTMILTVSGVVSGAVAERFKFFPLWAASLLMAGFVLPIAGRWAWGGWLTRLRFVDFGGGTWLHVAAASCAAVAAIVVGPRNGKFNRDGSSAMIPGHNIPLAASGALMMLIGFIPYVAGAGMAHIPASLGEPGALAARGALNVLFAAAAAGFTGMLLCHVRYGKADIGLVLMAILGGAVAMTAGANLPRVPAAVLTGAIAGVIVPLAAVALDLRGRIDDPAGTIAVHGVGGAWGTLAVGLFVGEGTPADRVKFIGVQLLGITVIAAFSAVASSILFVTLKKTVGVRSKEADEFDGLDLAEHDIGAYPDFQQTTIKSYHLREV